MSRRDLPDEVLHKATECEKDYRCLTCNSDELCQVRYYPSDGGICIIECAKEEHCPYVEVLKEEVKMICN